jgi:hypothetical protein
MGCVSLVDGHSLRCFLTRRADFTRVLFSLIYKWYSARMTASLLVKLVAHSCLDIAWDFSVAVIQGKANKAWAGNHALRSLLGRQGPARL